MKHRLLKVLTTAICVVVAGTASAQVDYQKIGNTVFGSDGSTHQQIGNTTFSSDSKTYQQIGNTTFSSDGRNWQQIGNTTFGSDGTITQQIGNTTYQQPTQQTCTQVGSMLSCSR